LYASRISTFASGPSREDLDTKLPPAGCRHVDADQSILLDYETRGEYRAIAFP